MKAPPTGGNLSRVR